MIAALRSELLLLNRFRIWVTAGIVTVVFCVTATAILVATAQPAGGLNRPGGGSGIPLEQLSGPGGATAAVSWAIYGFGFLLVLVLFAGRLGSEFSSGTFRTALLHQPNRWSVIGGKTAALMLVTSVLVLLGLGTGAVTWAVVAPGQNIDTAGWLSGEGVLEMAIDFVRTVGWALGWALIAATLAVLLRSVPLALGIGVFWFGPIENVIGDSLDFALRWFPGLLLQQLVSGSAGAVSSTTAALTLSAYALVMVTVVVFTFKRLDVTS